MSLAQTFHKAARTVFKVFKSLIHKVEFVRVTNDGFDEETETKYPVDMIVSSFEAKDVELLSFNNLIQPTDVKGMFRGEQLKDFTPATTDVVVDGEVTYSVVATQTDPAKALWILLLRNT